MYAQIEKTKKNKSRAVANYVIQKSVKQSYTIQDNREGLTAQNKMIYDQRICRSQKAIQRMLFIGGDPISSGKIVNKSQQLAELNEAFSSLPLEEKFRIQAELRELALDRDTHNFTTWADAVEALKGATSSSHEGEKAEDEPRRETTRFSRTGHTKGAHGSSALKSSSRARRLGGFNGRWKNITARDELITRFFEILQRDKMKKGVYFVSCDIPLEVGCADDEFGEEHRCDGFFIKMTSMGTSIAKWKFSTCHPREEKTLGGTVTRIIL